VLVALPLALGLSAIGAASAEAEPSSSVATDGAKCAKKKARGKGRRAKKNGKKPVEAKDGTSDLPAPASPKRPKEAQGLKL
jgi:hypothetical protein